MWGCGSKAYIVRNRQPQQTAAGLYCKHERRDETTKHGSQTKGWLEQTKRTQLLLLVLLLMMLTLLIEEQAQVMQERRCRKIIACLACHSVLPCPTAAMLAAPASHLRCRAGSLRLFVLLMTACIASTSSDRFPLRFSSLYASLSSTPLSAAMTSMHAFLQCARW